MLLFRADQHLQETLPSVTAQMSPRDRSPVRTSSPRQHQEKTPGTSGALTIWLWNKLLIRLARGELSLVSPKVFSPFCHRWSFGSLPLSPLACLVWDTSFPAISSTWWHRYYFNWTELDNDITEFNNEMPSTENLVFDLVILHYWHHFPILILCSCFVKSTI